ncbi:MAG: bifunctional phosphoribosylaminoimidazolecarboxamide formyltransferase/IMP cyclohydrolase, partial [Bdellovibrionales bacterium]|nr:bifunctional phosphoribosylaminoimidazolecarboxamide formyltransferase/IMP cyclohydrolase [Bdellovibrionales bacterium]
VAILKHLNPCGAAVAGTLTEALVGAKQGDPRSHFGGIIAANQEIDAACANEIAKDFTEIVVAPSYSTEAKDILAKKKNVRVIELDFDKPARREMRSVEGGMLIQEPDPGVSSIAQAELQTERALSEQEKIDLQLAWVLCAHLKSNAICLVSNGMLLASGAGQMSRIDAVEVALMKAETHGHSLEGAVAASDAFFPFPDCVEVLAAAGVQAIIVPGGSKGDDAVVSKAKELGISLLFAADRHFRH